MCYVVGLMSGTSLDGVDAALVEINGFSENTKVNLIEFIELPIDDNLKQRIKNACDINCSNVEDICSLNFELGYLFSQAVKEVCNKANFPLTKLDYIGSHGQTIFHIPKSNNKLFKSTLQIGEPAVIAYETGTMVVSNFRVMDMAAGGQGAPLVPYTEYLLYKSDKNRCLQNIGGIGNVTVIAANCKLEDVFAFDTGPGNMIINELVKLTKGVEYDKDGYFASCGMVQQSILNELMDIDYISQKPPKTTGRELFGLQFTKSFYNKYKDFKEDDLIATVTQYTAESIVKNYKDFIMPKLKIDEVILSGGGSYNKTLVSMIRTLLPDTKVLLQEDIGLNSSAKEAIAFAILANETINKIPSNVPSATGAKERVVLGNITPNIKENNL